MSVKFRFEIPSNCCKNRIKNLMGWLFLPHPVECLSLSQPLQCVIKSEHNWSKLYAYATANLP